METRSKRNGRKFTKTYKIPATGTEDSSAKSKARYRIQKEVKEGEEYDIFDIVADMQKRIDLLESALAAVLAKKSTSGWNTLYKRSVSAASKESTALYTKLKARQGKIQDILKATAPTPSYND